MTGGLIAGWFSAKGPPHGFTRTPSGTIRVFDPAGSSRTFVNGCNDNGDVTGYYFDSSKVSHGFLRSKDE